MFKTNIEFRKGVLFIKVDGVLDKKNSSELKRSIIPLLLKNGFKYVVLNLDDVNYIDSYGIDVIDDINNIVIKFNGKTTLIKNNNIEKKIHGTLIDNVLYRVKNEKMALGVFELWTKVFMN